ncbi:MAG: ShlB/FhaC/HecB family hemolysin secretion/activation protein [Opitutales bacterium]
MNTRFFCTHILLKAVFWQRLRSSLLQCFFLLATLLPTQGGQVEGTFFLREIRVQGASLLETVEVQKAVYPYLGPLRTVEDVEAARAALEKLYHREGYQTVVVEIPPQQVSGGVVRMQVNEVKIGRMRVRGSRYHDLEEIRETAPSLLEGATPNFDDLVRDVVALNRRPHRRIYPELKPGADPDTVDIDLVVEDELPLNASLGLNNRYSSGTGKLRLNAAASYENLWQRGHVLGFNMQINPEDVGEVQVFSGNYTMPSSRWDALTYLFSATHQNSDISTVGNLAVADRGDSFGGRMIFALPAPAGMFQSLSLGMDWKSSEQVVDFGSLTTKSPLIYTPINALFTSIHMGETTMTEFFLGTTFHFSGLGSDPEEWDSRRFNADPNFMTLRGEIGQTRDWDFGLQSYLRLHGQAASGPLISAEQFSGGGLDTVRGYLEGEIQGDNAVFGTIELRSINFLGGDPEASSTDSFRLHTFAEAGLLRLRDPLPNQESSFSLGSVGVGGRFSWGDHLSGSLEVALPLSDQANTKSGDVRVLFNLSSSL